MSQLDIHQIPVLSDNYVYLARDRASGQTAVVDPAVVTPVLEAAERLGWTITHILNTHHHGDHVGGNLEIKAATGCTIIGPKADRARIPGIDIEVEEGDRVALGEAVAEARRHRRQIGRRPRCSPLTGCHRTDGPNESRRATSRPPRDARSHRRRRTGIRRDRPGSRAE